MDFDDLLGLNDGGDDDDGDIGAVAPVSPVPTPLPFGDQDEVIDHEPKARATEAKPVPKRKRGSATFGADDEIVTPPREAPARRQAEVAPVPMGGGLRTTGEDRIPAAAPLARQAGVMPTPSGPLAPQPPQPTEADLAAAEGLDPRAPTQSQDFPPVTPLDDQPFRTGGSAIDSLAGPQAGMLPGDEAYRIRQEAIAGAETMRAFATKRREEAEAHYQRLLDGQKDLLAIGPAMRTMIEKNARKDAQLDRAIKAEQAAIAGVSAAQRGPLETQTEIRNAAEAFLKTLGGMGASMLDTGRGIAELAPHPQEAEDPALAGAMQGARAQLKRDTEGVHEAVARGARPDPAQAEEFGTKLVEGATSMAGFMAGGLATKAIGVSAAAGSGMLGALQMGGQQMREAEDAAKKLADRIAAMKADGFDATAEEAKLDGILRRKYLALFAGAGLGATEAIPIERFFNRLNQAANGRVAQILATTTAQTLEEAAQEIGQQLGSNLVAKVLYDEKRHLTEGVQESAAVAAVLGAVMGGGAGLVQVARGRRDGVPVPDAAPVDPAEVARQAQQGQTGTAETTVTVDGKTATARTAPDGPKDLDRSGDGDFPFDRLQSQGGDPAVSRENAGETPLDRARDLVRSTGKASPSFLQRQLGLGYGDAVRVIAQLEQDGVLGPADNAGKHPVLPVSRTETGENATRTNEAAPEGAAEITTPAAAQGVSRETSAPSTEIDEEATLREFGYTDEQIAAMPAKQRAAELEEAREAGVSVFAPSNEGAKSVAEGSRQDPHRVETAADLETVGQRTEQDPTPGQKEAGNFRMDHVRMQGMDFTIETVKGGTRKAADGSWEVKDFPAHYGYVKGTEGADGDKVDVYLGPDPTADSVFVVDQIDADTRRFDEHKAILGVRSEAEARAIYERGFSDGRARDRIGGITRMSVDEFKAWLNSGNTKKRLAKPKAEPRSLIQMIAFRGGLRPDAELRAIGLSSKDRVMIPGAGWRSVMRGNGMTMDELAEAMVEEGFLLPEDANRPGDSGIHNRIRDMIDEERRGRPARRLEQAAETDRGADERIADENAQRETVLAEHRRALEQALTENGTDPKTVYAADIARATELMADEGLDPDIAWERAILENARADELVPDEEFSDTYVGLEAWEDEVQRQAAPHDGGQAPEARSAEGARELVRGGREDGGQEAEGDEAGDSAVRAADAEAVDPAGSARVEFGADDELVDESDDELAIDDESTSPYGDRYVKPGEARKRGQKRFAGDPETRKVEAALRAGATQFGHLKVEIAPWVQDMFEATITWPDGDTLELRSSAGQSREKWIEIELAPYVRALLDRHDDLQQPTPWAEAEPGDLLEDGKSRLVKKGLKTRKAADKLAQETEGAIVIRDGADKFAVVKPVKQEPTTERTAAGDQTVLPGAEKIGQGEQAQRKADAPLKPKAPQKAADEGLFGDDSKQTDLLDAVAKAPGKSSYSRYPDENYDRHGNERPVKKLREQTITFASGMSRVNDLLAGAHTLGGSETRGIGVDVGELSRASVDAIARAVIDWKTPIFIDSGAFGLFRRNLRTLAEAEKELGDLFGDREKGAPKLDVIDFDKVLERYEDIEARIAHYNDAEETDYPRPLMVMPDIVGDQQASLDLVEKYKDYVGPTATFNLTRPIVPIQKGGYSLADAYRRVVEILGTDRFIVGIPSNEKAVSNAELREFLRDAKPKRIHFLGATAAAKLEPKLQAIADAGYTPQHISADANLLRSALYGRYQDSDPQRPRAEQIKDTLKKPPKGTLAALVHRLAFTEGTTHEDMGEWADAIAEVGVDAALMALRGVYELADVSYRQSQTIDSMAERIRNEIESSASQAASKIKGKGKKVEEQRKTARASFDLQKKGVKQIKEEMKAIRARLVAKAMKDSGFKDGDQVKVSGEFHDGRTGATLQDLYGTLHYREGDPFATVNTAYRGDVTFLGPDEIRDNLSNASEEEIEKAQAEVHWEFFDQGDEDTDSQFIADLLNGVVSGDYDIRIRDGAVSIEGSVIAQATNAGDMSQDKLIRSFLEAAQKEAGFDDGDRVEIEAAIEDRLAQQEADRQENQKRIQDEIDRGERNPDGSPIKAARGKAKKKAPAADGLDDASMDTLRHYAGVMGVPDAKTASKNALVTALREKGAVASGGGQIVAVPMTAADAVESLKNVGYGTNGKRADDNLFASFKAALRLSPESLTPSEFETEPDGRSTRFRIETAAGGTMDIAVYATTPQIIGGSFADDNRGGGMGSTYPAGAATAFMRQFIKEAREGGRVETAKPVKQAKKPGAAPSARAAEPQAKPPRPEGSVVTKDTRKSEWKEIGKNADGVTLYEDQRGVRSFLDGKVRIVEKILMRPTREGMEISTPERDTAYFTVAEQQQTAAEPTDDIQAALDQAMAEAFGAQDEVVVETPAEAKVRKAKRRAADAEGLAAANPGDPRAGREAKRRKEQADRTAGQVAKSAAKHAAAGAKDAIDALGELFGGKGKLSSGITFDDETYAKAKPLFIQAVGEFKLAAGDMLELARRLVNGLRSRGYGQQVIGNMMPYLHRFMADVKAGTIQLGEAAESGTLPGKEQADGDRGTEGAGPEALDGAPAAEGGGREGGRDAGSGAARGGEPRAERDRDADGEGLPGARGSRGGAAEVHPAEAGSGGRGRGRGARGAGARVSGSAAGAEGRERGRSGVAPEAAPSLPAVNFRITDEVNLGQGSEGVKFRDNLAAIETLKTIENENRRATADEQRTLARYVGWGGLANAFRQPDTKEFKADWKERGEQLESLLSPEELRAARRSTRNAHYTSKTVVDAMWQAAKRLGFKGGLALETSAGVGNFLGLVPQDIAGATKFVAVEYDSITARIAKALYPRETVLHSGFQRVPFPDGEALLVIGNPPFGSESLRFQHKPDLNGFSIHNQFFLAGLDALRPGGVQIMVVSRYLMDAQDARARERIAEKADLIAAIRLPDTAFAENARTEVVTDILILERRDAAGEASIREQLSIAGNSKKSEADRAAARRSLPDWIETKKVPDPLGGAEMTVNAYFARNPRQVLGRLERSGTMQAQGDEGKGVNVKLQPGQDLAKLLDEAVARLPQGAIDIAKEVQEATEARHAGLSESLEIALQGHEPGHIELNADGKLVQVMERETTSGDWELTRRTLDPQSPWSSRLLMDKDGRWYSLEPQSRADQLRAAKASLLANPSKFRTQAQVDAEVAEFDRQIAEAEKAGTKAKAGRQNLYERRYYETDAIPGAMRLGQSKYDRLLALARIRDLIKRQLTLEAEDAAEATMEGHRKKLAAAYNAFTREHGFINEPKNAALISEMPDGALLLALETGYRPATSEAKAKRTGEPAKPATAKQAPILSRRVVPKYEPATKADSPADAVSIVLSERGHLDMARIAQLLGVSEEEAGERLGEGERPLAFFDPELQAWQPASAYLSGQVVQKLNAARAAGLDKNVDALQKVQPEPWTADNVSVLIGANWVPTDVYEEFATHLLGGSNNRVQYFELTNAFQVSVGDDIDPVKAQAWSSGRKEAQEILHGMLNSRVPQVYDIDEDGTRHLNKEASALVEAKAREIESEFSEWVFRDGDRRRRLTEIYNAKFNTRVTRQHDGSHLTLPGKVPDAIIAMRRHQKNAIWRGIWERFVLYDHVVGAGKTFTAIARVMERRRMGLSRKPMIVVPNHLVDQWAADFYRLYPGAKILAAGKNQFDKKNRRRLFAKIATGDYDAVIVPHSSFGKVGISADTELRFLEEELRIAREAVEIAREEAGPQEGPRKPFTVKEAERLVETIQTRIDKLKSRDRDRLLTFEQLGVDDLTVDEAHEFKNLFYSSRLANVRGMGNKTGSQKAFDLYTKIRVLTESPRGSVAFATGTPISNSAVEMFTMMRYLAAGELKALGMEHFDAWRMQYVSASTAWEPTEAGGLKEVTRLGRQWSNMRALMELYYSFTDAVTQEDINKAYAEDNDGARFPVPKVKHGGRKEVVVKPTEAQETILQDVIAGFEGLNGISDPDERNIERLKLMDRARKVSLDARAADRHNTSKEEGGKLDQIADNVLRIYKATDADAGTQLVFLDRSVKSAKGDDKLIKEYDKLVAERDAALAAGDEETFRKITDQIDERFSASEIAELRAAQAGGWNAYDQLKQNLIARGILAEEIRFVQEANNDAEKKALFDAVNDGKVRVLIGSTPRMGAGTNVQERLVALHHGDVTWKPSDIEQREGRIIRQGNSLLAKYGDDFDVEILAYVTERTVDAKMWDLNATKLKMINGIRKYDGAFTMEFEDEDAVGMAEIAALASGDPLLLERVKLTGEIDKLELQQRAHSRRQFGIDDQIAQSERTIRDYPGLIEKTEANAKDIRAAFDAADAAATKRSVKVEGKAYKTFVDAAKAAADEIERQKGGEENAKYSINVDGNRYTNKDAINDAIHSALGDKRPFLARIGDVDMTRRSQVREVLLEKLSGNFASETTIPLGTAWGFDLSMEVQPRRVGATVTLALDKDGRSIVEAENFLEKITGQNVAGLFQRLENYLEEAAHPASPRLMREQIETAKRMLPALREQAGKPFAKADELKALRTRLEEVIGILDARTKASEGNRANMLERLTPRAISKRAALEKGLTDIVTRMLGRRVKIEFPDEITTDTMPEGWAAFAQRGRRITGMWFAGRRLIQVALGKHGTNVESVTYHEAFHAVQDLLLTDEELAILKLETPRLREIVRTKFGPKAPESLLKDQDIDALEQDEVQALAFEAFVDGRGVKIGIKPGRIFEKLKATLRRVRSFLWGLGFRTAEDVFEDAFSGAMAARVSQENREAPPMRAALQTRRTRVVRPGSLPLPVPQVEMPHERVMEALRDPNLSRSEALSAAIDAALLTPSRALWDRLIDIARLQRAAELLGNAKIPQRLDTYLAATLYPGRVGERMRDAQRDLFEPIFDAMKRHNISRQELHEYLYARHAAERNAQIRSIDPNNTEGSGMSDADAQAILTRANTRQADYDAVAQLVDGVIAENRNLIEREGLEDTQTILEWENAYAHYVPLKGAEASEDEYGTPPRGQGFDVRRGESRRALGRFSRAGDILSNILDQTQRTIIRAEKNRVAKTFLRFAQANPSPHYKIGLAETRRRVNPQTGLLETVWVVVSSERDDVFAAKVGGETYYIQIHHGGLLEALKNLGADRMPAFFRIIGAFTRHYAAFQTARNPEFVVTNIMRDLADAGLNLTAEQRAGFQRRFVANLVNGRALLSAITGTAERRNNRFVALYDEWRLAGGKISMFGYKDLDTIRADIERELNRRTESRTARILKAPGRFVNPFSGTLVQAFEKLSDITESTTRLAVYAAARDIGLTQAEAARAARQTTVDFSQKGKYGPYLQSLYAFANPAMIGTVNVVRRLRKSKMMRRAAMGVAGLGFMLTMWNLWAAADDEDEKKNHYASLKHHERERHIVIFMPGSKTALKIPLGYALQPFWAIGENLAMMLHGKVKPMEGLGNWLGTTVKAFNPFGGEGSAFGLHLWIEMMTPTIADPLVQLGRNRNWLNRPIHPDERPWTKGMPHSEQSKVTTSPFAMQAAEWLNQMSGGNTFRKGAVDLYPDDLEFAWNFALGGFGKFVLNTGGLGADLVTGVDTPVERMPFVRRFVASGTSDAAIRSQFFDKSHNADEQGQRLRNALKALKTGVDVEDARETVQELAPKLGLRKGPRGGDRLATDDINRETGKALKDLRLQEKKIRTDGTLGRAERSEQLRQNAEQQRAIMKQGMSAFERLLGQ